MPVTWRAASPGGGPASSATAALGGVLSRDDAGYLRTTVVSALVERGSLILDVGDLRLHHPAAVEVFAEALAAAGGWPTARLVLARRQARVKAALSASGVVGEVPVASDLVSGRSRLCLRPDRVTRRLRLRPERSAPRRTRSFVAQAASAWSVEQAVRDNAATVAWGPRRPGSRAREVRRHSHGVTRPVRALPRAPGLQPRERRFGAPGTPHSSRRRRRRLTDR